MQVSKSTISKIIKKYKETGSSGPSKRSVKPRKISNRSIKKINSIVKKKPFTISTQISIEFSTIPSLLIAPSTVRSI